MSGNHCKRPERCRWLYQFALGPEGFDKLSPNGTWRGHPLALGPPPPFPFALTLPSPYPSALSPSKPVLSRVEGGFANAR